MPSTILFDVNETLLDLSVLDEPFRRIFDSKRARGEWFAQLLQQALVATVTDTYREFGILASESLDVIATKRQVALTDDDRNSILTLIGRLPPHLDVDAALDRLADSGARLFALTNSPPDTVKAQLVNAGLISRFEGVFSVDSVRRFKPHPATYQMAITEIGLAPEDVWMVAAHDWDVAGAIRAGLKGAFVARPGQGYAAGLPQPHIVGSDLTEVVDQLI